MKKWLNWLFLIALIITTFVFLFKGQEPDKIIQVFKTISVKFLFYAILAMVVYLLLEALMLHKLLNIKYKLASPIVSIKSMFIGQFYSLITPFASGGQPMQLIGMVKDGVRASHATAVLVNKFLDFQIGVTIYSLVLFLFNWSILLKYLSRTYGLIAVGIIFNSVGLILIIMMILSPLKIKALVNGITKVLTLLKLKEERVEHLKEHWIKEIDEFSHCVQLLLVNPMIILKLSVLTLIQLTAYFGITYFVYRAFGQVGKSFYEVVALQSILYMSISLIPAPGSAGVAEGGFLMVFSSLFPQGVVTSAVLAWRGITYYINLIVSGIITIIITANGTLKSNKT